MSEYVNSFNLPAWFSESYPFKVTWDLGLSLKPVRRYVVSWSEDMVKSGAGQGVAAYWMLVELETGVSACSADIVAEEMRACLSASVLIRKRCWLWNNRVVSVVFVGCKGVCCVVLRV